MTAVAFLGPTLPAAAAVAAGVSPLPPAGCGDVLRALDRGATAIGLVDGTFHAGRAVWHKEILVALAAGVPVLGAASMGALRAAELAAEGMTPIGGIAAEYLSGRRVADADVAVLHGGPEVGWRAASEALVDVVDLVATALARGLVTAAEARTLRGAAEAVHWTGRTLPAVVGVAELAPAAAERLLALATRHPRRKGRDARLLLASLARVRRPGTTVAPPPRTRLLAELGAAVEAELHPFGRVTPLLPGSRADGDGAGCLSSRR